MRGLKHKRVMITGAANGIGRETAMRFHQEGATVYLVDKSCLGELKALLPERAFFIQADVTQVADLEQIDQFIASKGLDVLINNAGITRDASLLKMERAQWDQVIDVNLTAVFSLSQIAARVFKAQQSGVILNAASVVAHYGNFGQTNYAATKAGVIAMTKTMARELGKYGIRVNAVAPGFIATGMTNAIPEKILNLVKEKPPLKRLGSPADVAAAYAFLASEDAAYITGATLNVDGGIVLG